MEGMVLLNQVEMVQQLLRQSWKTTRTCEFDAVQHYNLDSVSSSVLRIGARYGTTDKKWNWYGGLAYEYEFDGEAEGVVNGVAIRAASIKGSSVRGEVGLRMNATKTNPWQMDISIITESRLENRVAAGVTKKVRSLK